VRRLIAIDADFLTLSGMGEFEKIDNVSNSERFITYVIAA